MAYILLTGHVIQQDIDDQQSVAESTDEEIVVTREEEAVDPEVEAEFEREYAKLMAESLEARKFDRKPLFDAPVPVMAKNREQQPTINGQTPSPEPASSSTSTMAIALLTKKGNRQQVC